MEITEVKVSKDVKKNTVHAKQRRKNCFNISYKS